MKIVNICLAGSYNYGWGYQDNLITKYQARVGNEVTMITSQFVNDKNSEDYIEIEPETRYDNGVKVIRLQNGFSTKLTKLFRHYKGLYKTLEEENPDFIMIHCPQFLDIHYVCKYLKKHKDVICVIDGHADHSNSAQSLFATLVHKTLWKIGIRRIDKYVKKYYGVLPVRCDFFHEMYGINQNKIELLVMGADDDLLDRALNNKENTRKKYQFDENEIIILTGGKIDAHKTETIDLMKCINEYSGNKKIRLAVFGSIATELQKLFDENLNERILHLGWLNQEEMYDLICASDLGFFPGRHSVIWEQMVAAGIPCVFKDLRGTHHVDIGGNCKFLKDPNKANIFECLNNVLKDETFEEMKKMANKEEKNSFRYSFIAKKSLECRSGN